MEEKKDKDFKSLEQEIRHEKNELNHLKEELAYEEKKLEGLENEIRSVEKNEHSGQHKHHHHHQHDHEKIKLIFIVNGTPAPVVVNKNCELKTAVVLALKESGNEARPYTDWGIKWNNTPLDLNKKIEDYHFPECAELFLSLNAGHGGGSKIILCKL